MHVKKHAVYSFPQNYTRKQNIRHFSSQNASFDSNQLLLLLSKESQLVSSFRSYSMSHKAVNQSGKLGGVTELVRRSVTAG